MASAYSIVRNYNQFIPPVNLELMAQALSVKQQNYDQGYQMVQSAIDFTKNIDLVKAEDKQYLNERITKLTNDLNSLGGVDLGSKGVQSVYKKYLNQALDDNVINGVVSTQKYRAFQSEVQKIQEKDPKSYSTINEMYALRPFMQYINDGKVGSKLDNLIYSPKVDVNAKMTKVVKEAFEKHGERTDYQISADNWAKEITKTAGIEGEKIRSFVEANMTAEDRQQLAIDGWYNMGMADENQAKKILSDHQLELNKELDSKIYLLESSKKNKSKSELLQVEESIKNIKETKKSIGSLSNQLRTSEQIGAYFENEKLVGGLQDMYGKFLKSRELTTNDVYAKKMDYLFNREKFAWDKQVKTIELDQKEREIQQKDTANPNNVTFTLGGDINPDEKDFYEKGVVTVIKNAENAENSILEAFKKTKIYNDSPDKDKFLELFKDENGKVDYKTIIRYLKEEASTDEAVQYYGDLDLKYTEANAKRAEVYKGHENLIDFVMGESMKSLQDSRKEIDSVAYVSWYDGERMSKLDFYKKYRKDSDKITNMDYEPEKTKYINSMHFFAKMYKNASSDAEKKQYEILYETTRDKYHKEYKQKDGGKTSQSKYYQDIENNTIDRIKADFGHITIKNEEKNKSFLERLSINNKKTDNDPVYTLPGTRTLLNTIMTPPDRITLSSVVEQKLKDTNIQLYKEYGNKDVVLKPKENKVLYDEAKSVFSQSLKQTPFVENQDIIMRDNGDGTITAYQKWVNGEGESKQIISEPIKKQDVQELAPKISSTINFNAQRKKEFQEVVKDIPSWRKTPSLISSKNSNIKVIDDNIEDEAFKNNLKDLVNNSSKYQIKTERDEFNAETINLYDKKGALVYTSNNKEMLGNYLSIPELLISEAITNIINQYNIDKIKPTYFQ